ncbi:caspase-1-like [Anopheles albimanus]|nr:caspase-1-like [Anopheles albimanus]
MNHENRGIAIVVNQKTFDKLPERHGTVKDGNDIQAVLKNLQFDVETLNNRTKKKLFEGLDEIAKKVQTNHDCLAVVVMTHGDPGVLYAKDETYKIDELWNKFTGDSCKALHGKPKLFFIQSIFHTKPHTIQCDKVDAQDTSRAKRSTYTIPTMANLLVMHSIYDGDKPRHDASKGSWFIQSLCAALNSHGHSKELLRILTVVSRNVDKNFRQYVPKSKLNNALKMMPCIASTLTKALYFRPKPILNEPLDGKNIISLDSNE